MTFPNRANDRGEFYFFGCWNKPGHFIYGPSGMTLAKNFPFGSVDYKFCPVIDDEHIATLTHLHGWTILAMRDYSIDKRGNSNAAFIAEGSLDFLTMWSLAINIFPTITPRLAAFKMFQAAPAADCVVGGGGRG